MLGPSPRGPKPQILFPKPLSHPNFSPKTLILYLASLNGTSPYSIALERSSEIGSQVQKSLFWLLADFAKAWIDSVFTVSL